MSSLKVYNNFKPPNYLKSVFFRSAEMEMWDTNTQGGSLKPFSCPVELCSGTPQYESLYPLRACECLGIGDVAGAIKGFSSTQHFLLQGGQLVVSSTASLCSGIIDQLAGVPSPDAPTFTTATCSDAWCGVQGLSYLVTNVISHEGIFVESSPSPPSDIKQIHAEIPDTVVSLPPVTPNYGIVSQRIYRVEVSFSDKPNSGSSLDGVEWVLVAEVPAGTSTYNDSLTSNETGFPLTTNDPEGFVAPDNLVGLARSEDGVVVATTDQVFISYPGQPLFGFEGVVNVEDTIRSIQCIGNSIFVLTDNRPVFIQYTYEKSFINVQRKTIYRDLPVVSLKSISVYGSRVYFASTFGLMVWDVGGYGSDVKNVVEPILNPEQWKLMQPDSIVGVAFEFGYLLYSQALDESYFFELVGSGIDTKRSGSVMPITFIKANCFSRDKNGLIIYQENDKIFRWDFRTTPICTPSIGQSETTPMCTSGCPYQTKIYFVYEGKAHPRVMRIEWDERTDMTLDLIFSREHFGVTEEVARFKVVSSRAFGIPAFLSAQNYSVTIIGLGVVTEIRVATAYADLITRPRRTIDET